MLKALMYCASTHTIMCVIYRNILRLYIYSTWVWSGLGDFLPEVVDTTTVDVPYCITVSPVKLISGGKKRGGWREGGRDGGREGYKCRERGIEGGRGREGGREGGMERGSKATQCNL